MDGDCSRGRRRSRGGVVGVARRWVVGASARDFAPPCIRHRHADDHSGEAMNTASRRASRWLLLLLAFCTPAFAQFQFFSVDGNNTERPAPSLYDFGSFYAGESGAARFRLRNMSAGPAMVTSLTVGGAGFTLAAPAPALPVTLDPLAALNLTVNFVPAGTGSYSAALRSDGVSMLLVATVLPRLTYRTPGGNILSGAVDFGSVVHGSSLQGLFTLTNETPQNLIVPAISVQGADFTLAGTPPSGQAYVPQQRGEFMVVFAPRSTGLSQGTLTVGDRTYPLSGTSIDPLLPKPFLTIDLPQVASAQQGVAIIRFDTAVRSAGAGTLTLDFRGPTDAAVAFASGGRTANFTVAPGDTQVAIPFQTGTTAGTLAFTAQLGSATDQLSVPIPSAPVGVATTQAARAASSVEVTVTGFDNTRTLGALAFNFYDSGGTALTPAAIRMDAGTDFAKYFSSSDLGGVFVLHAVFPVTGDTSRIASYDVSLTNSAGSAKTPRISLLTAN
jgi:hypothetical protein